MSEAVVCTSYPLVLAAQDVIPIALAGLGYLYLSRRFAASVPAVVPAVRAAVVLLVTFSLIAGPFRKVLVNLADAGQCYPGLQVPFFSALAPGFAILMWGAISTLRGRKVTFWPFAALLALGVIAAVAADNRVILLATGGLWAVGLAASAAVLAKRAGDWPAVALFAVYALGTLALPVIGGRDDVSSLRNQWLAQGTNTVSQALFAYASYRLLTAFRRQAKTSTVETAT